MLGTALVTIGIIVLVFFAVLFITPLGERYFGWSFDDLDIFGWKFGDDVVFTNVKEVENVGPLDLGNLIFYPHDPEVLDNLEENPGVVIVGSVDKNVGQVIDKVTLSVTRNNSGSNVIVVSDEEKKNWFNVVTRDSWTADIVDGKKKPMLVKGFRETKLMFSCYDDDFHGTSSYFGVFQNTRKPDLTIEVFVNEAMVQTKSTSNKKSLILEGSCLDE